MANAKRQLNLVPMPRADVEHILDSFTALKRREEKEHGEFKTKTAVLREFDSMGEAIRRGGVYRTRLDPPPGDPRAAHQPRKEKCALCKTRNACCGERCHACPVDLAQRVREFPKEAK